MIMLSMICLLCIMTSGYAAFQANLNLTAKGNITSKKITPNELKHNIVTSGDGLYKDVTEEGRYIYKGTAPNNYIRFNDEMWRIMSIEADNTLKIIRNTSIGDMKWDSAGARTSSTSTYCKSSSVNGCNAWASTSNLINTPSDFTLHYPNGNPTIDSTTYSGTVTKDALLNTYLNTTYYNSLMVKAKSYIIKHNFNVGSPGGLDDEEDITTNIVQEAIYKWNGNIGLMNVTDVLKTTTNTDCVSLKVGGNNYTKSICSENNWVWTKNSNNYTISPVVDSGNCRLWYLDKNGFIWRANSDNASGIRPVVYLKSDITLDGEGTETNPYIITTE